MFPSSAYPQHRGGQTDGYFPDLTSYGLCVRGLRTPAPDSPQPGAESKAVAPASCLPLPACQPWPLSLSSTSGVGMVAGPGAQGGRIKVLTLDKDPASLSLCPLECGLGPGVCSRCCANSCPCRGAWRVPSRLPWLPGCRLAGSSFQLCPGVGQAGEGQWRGCGESFDPQAPRWKQSRPISP